MYGKIYKWKQEKPKEAVCVPHHPLPRPRVPFRGPQPSLTPPPSPWRPSEVYVSFGGLLMRLRGDSRHLRRTLSEKTSPGRPVGRPSTAVCRRLAGSGLHTGSIPARGWLGAHRNCGAAQRAVAAFHACDGVLSS